MLRLNPRQREALSETAREFANLSVGALALGQFLNGRPFSRSLVLLGIGLWVGATVVGIRLLTEDAWKRH